jgi:hypothetical protein
MPCPCGGKELEFTELSFPTEPNEMLDGESAPQSSKTLGLLYEVDEKRIVACLEDVCNSLLN